MQTLAAYTIFLLGMVAVGLAVIFGAVVSLVVYEGIASMKSRAVFNKWERARIFIDDKLRQFSRELHAPLFHAHR